jgi:transposase
LDVHKKTITACLLISGARGKEQHEIRRFGTMTRDLLALADWLQGSVNFRAKFGFRYKIL